MADKNFKVKNGIDAGDNSSIGGDLTVTGNIVSPTLTGTPTAPTAAAGTNTTQIATTAFVNSEITNDVTTAFVNALNVNADTVDSLHATSFIRSDVNDTATGTITMTADTPINFTSTGDTPKLDASTTNKMWLDGFVAIPKGYAGGDGLTFRFDDSDTAYIFDSNSGTALTINAGTSPPSGSIERMFGYTNAYTNINAYKDGSNNFEFEVTGISVSSSSNNRWWAPYVLFHAGGTAVTTCIVEGLEGDGTTWTELYNGDCRDVIAPRNYTTFSTGILKGLRFKFQGITGNSYLKMVGATSTTSPSFGWQMLKDGGSFYGEISGKDAGTEYWSLTNDGQLDLKKTFDSTDAAVGSINLMAGSGNFIYYQAAGVAGPTTTTRSAGTKAVWYPSLSSSLVDYATGITGNTLWNSVPGSSQQFAWYAGTTEIATLNGSGDLAIDGDLTVSGAVVSPALTGTPTAPTAAAGTNTTQLATTAFVQSEMAAAGLSNGTLDLSSTAPVITFTETDQGSTNDFGRIIATSGSMYLQHEGGIRLSGNANADMPYAQIRLNSAWNDIWHAGNDGAGSGLDADLLDGNEATAFLLLSGGTMTGQLNMNGNSINYGGNFYLDSDIGSGNPGINFDSTDYIDFNTTTNTYRVVIGGGEKLKLDATTATLTNYVFDIDQTVGAGQDNYVLTYDNGTGLISLEAAAGNVSKVGTPVDNQVGVWTGDGTIEGSTALTFSSGALQVVGSGSSVNRNLAAASPVAAFSAVDGTYGINFVPRASSGSFASGVSADDALIYYSKTAANTGFLSIAPWNSGNRTFRMGHDGTFTWEGNDIYHAGNDGSGSGLDADTVDGLQASQFLRSDASDTMNGSFTCNGEIYVDDGIATTRLRIANDNSRVYFQAYDKTNTNTGKGIRFGGYGGKDLTEFGVYANGGLKTIWHAGNDGSGSGLDADLLRGYGLSTSATGDTVVLRNIVGDITGRYIYGSYLNMNHAVSTRSTDTVFYSSYDNFVRKNNATGMRAALDVPHLAGTNTFTGTNSFTGTAEISTDLTFEGGKHRISINDGGGNIQWRFAHDYGDTNSGQFTGTEDGYAGIIQFNQATGVMEIGPNSASPVAAGATFTETASGILAIRPTSISYGVNLMWHAGNDGAGSGLDADLLDGQEGSYYLDYNNATNTPTIPAAAITSIAQIRNTSAITDLNGTASYTDVVIDGENDFMDGPDFTDGTTGVVCNFDGRVKITVHAAFSSIGQRASPQIRAAVAGVGLPIEGKTGYIRAAGTNSEASCTATQFATVTDGDEVTLQSKRGATDTTVCPGDAGGCMILVERIT